MNVIDILDKDIISQNEKVRIKLRENIRIMWLNYLEMI
jgi:hypothetical protein